MPCHAHHYTHSTDTQHRHTGIHTQHRHTGTYTYIGVVQEAQVANLPQGALGQREGVEDVLALLDGIAVLLPGLPVGDARRAHDAVGTSVDGVQCSRVNGMNA